MPDRYLLICVPMSSWRLQLEQELAACTGLCLTISCSTFAVLASPKTDVIGLPRDGGAIIGKLFYRFGAPRSLSMLPNDESERIIATEGQLLLDRFWGSYVALVSKGGAPLVLRAPLGTLPCYYTNCREGIIFASDAELLCKAGKFKSEVNWGSLRWALYARDLPSDETSVLRLKELQGGFALKLLPAGPTVDQRWFPWNYVSMGRHGGSEEIAETLQRTVQACVSATASPHRHITVGVSGGLDSSVVASSIRTAHVPFQCLTLVTEDPVGDERPFARHLCDHLNCELVEAYYDLGSIDLEKSVVAHLPRPCGRIHEQGFHAVVANLMEERSSDALFTGNGGDNVFYNSSSARPVIDRFRAEGFGVGTLSTLRDVCMITGSSAWPVLREAIRVTRAGGRAYKWKEDTRFLHPDVIEEQQKVPLDHPWLDGPPNASSGKAGHIAMLLRMQHHLDNYDRSIGFSVVSPLTSQPLVELCLSIPSWESCAGGVNRAPVRAAFKGILPPMIIDRRSKGGPDGFLSQIVNRYLPEIRGRLLDGGLARQGILDLALLSGFLASPDRLQIADYMRIMALLDTEAWIARWDRTDRNGS